MSVYVFTLAWGSLRFFGDSVRYAEPLTRPKVLTALSMSESW